MSAHVLLNLLYELRKSFFATSSINKLKKFNNTGARMLDSIYHMPLNTMQNKLKDGVC